MNFFEFLKDGLSIEETKVSSLILIFVFTIGLATYMVLTQGDVPLNLTEIIKILIFAIAGVNVADKINEYLGRKF
jgi:uncharacterized membrane protein YfcA